MSEPDLTKPVNGMKGGKRQQAAPPKATGTTKANTTTTALPSRPKSEVPKSEVPKSEEHDDPPEEDISDEHHEHHSNARKKTPTPKVKGKLEPHKEPAYVSPIPKIGSIPSIGSRPQLPRYLTSSIVGMKINETGDVVDENGTIHGRVAGDLPSMVGRTVMNQRGDVLGDDGELLGYVAELEADKKKAGTASPTPSQSLDDYIGQRKSQFSVDHLGQIVDDKGEVVGNFHDYKKMGPKPDGRQSSTDKEPGVESEEEEEEGKGKSGAKQEPKEERQNAQSFRNPSPSDIFLDVKSTREGIQLTIRIPTVFGNREPKITFS